MPPKKVANNNAGVEVQTEASNYAKSSHKEEDWEFGGPVGATALMVWSHYILIYFWYCLETNSGNIVIPTSVGSLTSHLSAAYELILTKGIPSKTIWIAYFFFFLVQLVLAGFMPGITMQGLPTAPHGKRLNYHCNGYSCYYLCLIGLFVVHYLDIFPITFLAENFGQCLFASMIIADVTAVAWYLYGLAFADEHNGKASRTGNVIYDFFMGSILYPRIGEVDIKMIAECRWSWLTLMCLTLSCAVKQYQTLGHISPNMAFMVYAHWLYSNATVKGEHCIPCTWDMFRENYGWMLNFWNICGVPFLYCYQSLFILKNQALIDATYPPYLIYFNFALLTLAYYIFDSANCQKASCKVLVRRFWAFPQVPWAILEDPPFIKTPKGNLLVGGWYAFCRKLQYTGDILMAASWGLACGFTSPLPYFYLVFFTGMIIHRQSRDEARCAAKYGKYWVAYTNLVPNVFLPSLAFYKWLLTGKHPLDGVDLSKLA